MKYQSHRQQKTEARLKWNMSNPGRKTAVERFIESRGKIFLMSHFLSRELHEKFAKYWENQLPVLHIRNISGNFKLSSQF